MTCPAQYPPKQTRLKIIGHLRGDKFIANEIVPTYILVFIYAENQAGCQEKVKKCLRNIFSIVTNVVVLLLCRLSDTREANDSIGST